MAGAAIGEAESQNSAECVEFGTLESENASDRAVSGEAYVDTDEAEAEADGTKEALRGKLGSADTGVSRPLGVSGCGGGDAARRLARLAGGGEAERSGGDESIGGGVWLSGWRGGGVHWNVYIIAAADDGVEGDGAEGDGEGAEGESEDKGGGGAGSVGGGAAE